MDTKALDQAVKDLAKDHAERRNGLETQILDLINEVGGWEVVFYQKVEAVKAEMIAAGRDAGAVDEHIEQLLEQVFSRN